MGQSAFGRRPMACMVIGLVAVSLATVGVAKGRSRAPDLRPALAGTVYLPDGKLATKVTLHVVGVANWYVGPVVKRGTMVSGGGLVGGAAGRMTDLVTDARGRYRWQSPFAPPNQEPPMVADAVTYGLCLYSPNGLGYAILDEVGGLDAPSGKPLDIHLQAGDRVDGRVVGYPGGKPMAGVKVSVSLELQRFMMHFWPTVEETTTDGEGRFRLASSLPPKLYNLHAAPPAEWLPMGVEVSPPPSDTPAAHTVEVQLVHAFTITGHVYGLDGQPVRNTRLDFGVQGDGFGGGGRATTDAEGAYALPQTGHELFYEGPRLSRYLTLTPRYEQQQGVVRSVRVDATDPSTYTADIHFVQPGKVVGHQVEAHTGRPAVGVRAGLEPGYYDGEHSEPKDDETGAFVLRQVVPGEYGLQFEGLTIRPHMVGNGQAVPVEVKPGETVDVGTVPVQYVPHLSGHYTGLPGKWGDYELHAVLRPVGSKGPGQEGFADLWAGDGKYTVWAYDRPAGRYDVAVLAYKDGFPRYVATTIRGVALEEDGPAAAVDIAFTRGASIRGKVLRENGGPLRDIAVTVNGRGGDAMMLNAPGGGDQGGAMWIQLGTNAKGEFAVQGLPPGTYEITAHAEPLFFGPKPTMKVTLAAGEQKTGLVMRTRRNGE